MYTNILDRYWSFLFLGFHQIDIYYFNEVKTKSFYSVTRQINYTNDRNYFDNDGFP